MSMIERRDTDLKLEVRANNDEAAAEVIAAFLATGKVSTVYLRDRASEPGRLVIVSLRRE